MLKEKSRKLLSLFLALLLLSSCGSTVETESDDTVDNETESTVIETEPSEYTSPDVDYDGATVTVAAIDYAKSGGGAWAALSYCEAYSDLTGDVLHDALYERNVAVMEDLNIALETFSLSSFANAPGEFKTPILAGETFIDYCLMNGSGLSSILTAGMLVDLHDISTLDTSHSWWDQNSVEEFTLGDTLYTMTGDISLYTGCAPITYFFNKDLITLHNLEDPYSIVNEGKWTIDKSIEMAYAVAQDVNGNGQVDLEEDIFGICCQGENMTHAVYGSDVRITERDENGMPYLVLEQEKAASVVEKMGSFLRDNTVSLLSEKISGYGSNYSDLFLPALKEGRSLFFTNQLMVALNLRDMDADFGILPTPKYDETQKNYCCPVSYWWATFVIIPVTNGRLDMTGNVLEATGYYSQKLVAPAYIEKSIQGKTFRDEESTAMLELILDNRVYELAAIYDWGGVYSMFAALAVSGAGFASTYASKEATVITAIEKTIEDIKALS